MRIETQTAASFHQRAHKNPHFSVHAVQDCIGKSLFCLLGAACPSQREEGKYSMKYATLKCITLTLCSLEVREETQHLKILNPLAEKSVLINVVFHRWKDLF